LEIYGFFYMWMFGAYKNTSPMLEQSTALGRAFDKTYNIIFGSIICSGLGFIAGLSAPLVMVVMSGQKLKNKVY
jgi:hypothetical protein